MNEEGKAAVWEYESAQSLRRVLVIFILEEGQVCLSYGTVYATAMRIVLMEKRIERAGLASAIVSATIDYTNPIELNVEPY